MSRMALVVLMVSLLGLLVWAGDAAARERWRRPLPGGSVIGPFSFDRSAPYERGRRRGIDVRARPGARVLAACSGVVTHVGRVPRWGTAVTLRCDGSLVATELGLASAAVGRGARVLAGAAVGRLASRGVLRLGARVAARRHGYVDPERLLDDAGAAPPAAPLTARRRPRAVAPRVAGPPAVVAQPSVARTPWSLVAGLALLAAAGAGGGAATRGPRRRLVRAEALAVQR